MAYNLEVKEHNIFATSRLEKILATKGENRRIWALLSNLWKCRMADISKADKKAEKIAVNWRQYERHKARKHRGKHVGGPRKPDYTRGRKKGEVRHRKSPVTKPELQRAVRKGVREMDSLGGYTKPALKYAQRTKVKLFRRGRRV